MSWGGLFVLAIALLFRFWDLATIPGLNADEAWYGMVAQQIVRGSLTTLHTPNGNWVNPFYMFPHLMMALVAPPSFLALRLVSALYGIGTLALGWWSAKRLWGQRSAEAVTLFLACLPILIAYSRLNWDPSMSVASGLLVLFACEMKNPAWVGLAFFVALMAHPTNVLLSVFAAATVMKHSTWRELIRPVFVLQWVSAFALPALLILKTNSNVAAQSTAFYPQLSRLFSFSEIGQFLAAFAEYIWGAPIYEYIAGQSRLTGAHEWAIVCAIGLPFALYGYTAWKNHSRDMSLQIAGFLLTLVMTYLTVGTYVLSAHTERYGLYLVPGVVWLVGSGVTNLNAKLVRTLPAVLGFIWLGVFYFQYFAPFYKHGGIESHRTFRTAKTEPKLQAFQILKKWQQDGSPFVVWAEDWWIAGPLYYLGEGQLPVQQLDQWSQTAPLPPGAVLVVYHSSPVLKALNLDLLGAQRAEVLDRNGQAFLDIIRLPNPSN